MNCLIRCSCLPDMSLPLNKEVDFVWIVVARLSAMNAHPIEQLQCLKPRNLGFTAQAVPQLAERRAAGLPSVPITPGGFDGNSPCPAGCQHTRTARITALEAQSVVENSKTVRIHGPAGRDAGRKSLGEIAISISVRIIQSYRKGIS